MLVLCKVMQLHKTIITCVAAVAETKLICVADKDLVAELIQMY